MAVIPTAETAISPTSTDGYPAEDVVISAVENTLIPPALAAPAARSTVSSQALVRWRWAYAVRKYNDVAIFVASAAVLLLISNGSDFARSAATIAFILTASNIAARYISRSLARRLVTILDQIGFDAANGAAIASIPPLEIHRRFRTKQEYARLDETGITLRSLDLKVPWTHIRIADAEADVFGQCFLRWSVSDDRILAELRRDAIKRKGLRPRRRTYIKDYELKVPIDEIHERPEDIIATSMRYIAASRRP